MNCTLDLAGMKYWECNSTKTEKPKLSKPKLKDENTNGMKKKCLQKKKKCLKDCSKAGFQKCKKFNRNPKKKKRCKQCRANCSNKLKQCLKSKGHNKKKKKV